MTGQYLTHEEMRAQATRSHPRATTTPTATAGSLPAFVPPPETPEILGQYEGSPLTHTRLREISGPGGFIETLEGAESLTDEGAFLLENLVELQAEIATQARRQTRAEALARVRETGIATTVEEYGALDAITADRERRRNATIAAGGVRGIPNGWAETPEQLKKMDQAYGRD